MSPLTLRFRQLLVGMCLAAAISPAWSFADPANGSSIYSARCASCHGTATSPSIPQVLFGRNSPSTIKNAIAGNVGGMGVLRDLSDAEITDVAAFLGNAPAALNFPVTPIGQQSAPQSVTVRASSRQSLTSLSASADGDFRLSGGTCGTNLAAGQSCTVGVQFAPTVEGQVVGGLTLVNSAISAIKISIAGTGAVASRVPTLLLSANNIAFGDQIVSTASDARNVTVSNVGTAALNFSSIGLSAGAVSNFSIGGTCRVGTPVAAGAQCTVAATFTPTIPGPLSATLNVASDGGPAQIALSGSGVTVAAPAAAFSAAQISFGNQNVGTISGAQTVLLANSGNAALSITSLRATAPFAISQNSCGTSLAAQTSCQLQLTFSPVAAGLSTGSLTLTSTARGTSPSACLSGSGVVEAPVLRWTPAPTKLDFGTSTVGSTLPLQTLTLTNQGPGSAVLSDFRLTGVDAGDFHIDGSSSCSTSAQLPAGSSCQVAVAFVPQAVGARGASLDVQSNASSPGPIALTGIGMAPPSALISLSATALSFELAASGGTASQILIISNTGSAPLSITSLALSSAAFSVAGSGAHPCSTTATSLDPGASCELTVGWSGGDTAASLTINSNAQQGAQSVTLAAQQNGAPDVAPGVTPTNDGAGGCTMGNGTGLRDPSLILMALAALLLTWRRRRRPSNGGQQ